MKKILIAFSVLICSYSFAQDITVKSEKSPTWKKIYRAEATKINDLVNTRLDVRFDFDKSYMYGKAWLTLHPHFYATDSLMLDAKGMNINEVAVVKNGKNVPLHYEYDSANLFITLDKTYKANENYIVYIDYVSKPNEVKAKGSAAITDAKGLYFINPKGEDKTKPTQIWTQGETEANSVWMPTIDKPNQKCTEQISMTVPSKYVTLSNGLMISQKNNSDGTRTDTWKLDLPNSPYLFFMGVGEFAIIKDSYKGKEVSYYVEKEYAPVARKIFGLTPEMIAFYSRITGVDYVWPKYSQIVGRDYVSGAMENTTATLHQLTAQQNARQLVDGNVWEEVIAHELFHHWFGDLVTCESWSNITLNESFADYSETLWYEYKYGKDAGDDKNFNGMQGYLFSGGDNKDLVRFYYQDKEDVFDGVSYNKGGRILNMLRNYVGDSAFFKSLNVYLTTNKFHPAEAQQLRLAFEQVTGKDLNWYWNQWYYGSGHPKLKIDYDYDDAAGKAKVMIEQTQKGDKTFILPFAIDVYNGANKTRYNVWMKDKKDTFVFNYTARPDLINVDGDKILLCEKTDNKTADNYRAQLKYAPLYLDRREALEYFGKNHLADIVNGLSDKFYVLRSLSLDVIENDSALVASQDILRKIENLAYNDPNKKVQAKAIEVLASTNDVRYKALFEKFISDSSYSVAGASLRGLINLDSTLAYPLAEKYSNDAKGELGRVVGEQLIKYGSEKDFDFILHSYSSMPPGQDKVQATADFCNYLLKVDDVEKLKKGVDAVAAFNNIIPEQYRSFTDPVIKDGLKKVGKKKGGEVETYINNALQ